MPAGVAGPRNVDDPFVLKTPFDWNDEDPYHYDEYDDFDQLPVDVERSDEGFDDASYEEDSEDKLKSSNRDDDDVEDVNRKWSATHRNEKHESEDHDNYVSLLDLSNVIILQPLFTY